MGLLLVSLPADAQQRRAPARRPPAAAPAEFKTKVAEGKYLLRTQSAPIFEEPWVLSRTRLGYQLDEQWIFQRPQGQPPAIIDVSVSMVAGFRPLQVQVGSAPPNSMLCKIALREFSCESEGKVRKLDMAPPYDYFSPSPWILSNIVRRVKKDASVKSTIQLVRIDGADADGPRLSSFTATVQYVGDDQVSIGDQRHTASIYELRADGVIPGMLVWVSPEGIVLAMQDSSNPDQRMELAELKIYGRL